MFLKLFTFFTMIGRFTALRLARWLLTLLGWSLVESKVLDKLDDTPRAVYVFVHTSPMDWIFFTLYLLAYPTQTEYFYLVCHLQFHHWIDRLLAWTQTCLKPEQQTSFCRFVVDQLRLAERYGILICMVPRENNLEDARMHTGYYYIANALKCPIRAIGFDYKHRRLHVAAPRMINDRTPTQMEEQLLTDLQQMVPASPTRAPYLKFPSEPERLPMDHVISWLTAVVPTFLIHLWCGPIALLASIPIIVELFFAIDQLDLRRWFGYITVAGAITSWLLVGSWTVLLPTLIVGLINFVTLFRYRSLMYYHQMAWTFNAMVLNC